VVGSGVWAGSGLNKCMSIEPNKRASGLGTSEGLFAEDAFVIFNMLVPGELNPSRQKKRKN
jgi:hypothetical protein